MESLGLARLQFGLSLGFHYIFPQTTLGLALIIVLAEWRFLRSGDEDWRRVSAFAVRVLAVVFAFGIATGMVLPFTFGMNWSRFSVFAGPVFGLQLAIESVVAFTLESAFLAILLFGRARVSRRTYFGSALMVFLGSHLSAFFIVSANSWLQTPAGHALKDGRLVLVDWLAATFNPSVAVRYLHTVTAAWITGSMFTLAASAWLIRSGKDLPRAVKLFRLSAAAALALTLAQPLVGHQQIMDVLRNQPVKDAAYEGIFTSQAGAPLIGFGIPDAANRRIRSAIAIPKGLSLLETGNPNSVVKGLNDFPESTWPPVDAIFTTFHLMVPSAFVLLAAAALSFAFTRKGSRPIEGRRAFLLLPIAALPFAYLANELGWIGTEIGRQPWTVYGLLRTEDATTASQGALSVGFSLALFALVYLSLAVLAWRFTAGVVRAGIPGAGEESAHG